MSICAVNLQPNHEPVCHRPKIQPERQLQNIEGDPCAFPAQNADQCVDFENVFDDICGPFTREVYHINDNTNPDEAARVVNSIENLLESSLAVRHLRLDHHQFEGEH